MVTTDRTKAPMRWLRASATRRSRRVVFARRYSARWLRLASVMPLVLLVLGLVTIQHLHDQADIQAAAEVDAALLSDDLPPEAYGDPGFAVYLKQSEP